MFNKILILFLFFVSLNAFSGSHSLDNRFNEKVDVAAKAYIYMYPLVTMEKTRQIMSQKDDRVKSEKLGANKFNHIRTLPDPKIKSVVRPNFDTLYSLAWIQLDQGPIVFKVPDMKERFFMFPLLDMFTDVFAVIWPNSTTDGKGEKYIIIPPEWDGVLPDDGIVIQAPTDSLWLLGRIQINGTKDYENINQIQDQLKITKLDGTQYKDVHFDGVIDRKTSTLNQVESLTGMEFFQIGLSLLEKYNPHKTDWTLIQQMRVNGLYPSIENTPENQKLLKKAKEKALALLDGMNQESQILDNGWKISRSNIGIYGNEYLKRAYISRIGLGANPPEFAIYPLAIHDSSGNILDAKNNYIINFAPGTLPPNNAFWSITLYDEQGFPVENEISRFSIGDRSNLKQNEDGSTVIYLQHEKPSEDKVSNWLPTPSEGKLGVTMRIYAPKQPVLNGEWIPPVIQIAP